MPHETFAASRTPVSAEEAAPDLGKGRRIATFIAWVSVALAVAGGLAELMGGMGYRAHWWGAGGGIYTVGIGAIGASAACVIALAALFIAWLATVRYAMVIAGVGLVIGVLLAAPPLMMWRMAATLPPIHDITTDTENPPRFAAILEKRAGAPNGVEFSEEVAAN